MSQSSSTSRWKPYAISIGLGLGAANAPPVFVDGELPPPAPGMICQVERTGIAQGRRLCVFAPTPEKSTSVKLEWQCVKQDVDGGCELLEERPVVSDASPDAGLQSLTGH